MYCKLCNTRLNQGEKTCQNCGTAVRSSTLPSMSPSAMKLPSPEMSTARDTEIERESDDDEFDVELELDDVTAGMSDDEEEDTDDDSDVVETEPDPEPKRETKPGPARSTSYSVSRSEPRPKPTTETPVERKAENRAKPLIRNPFKAKSSAGPKPTPAPSTEPKPTPASQAESKPRPAAPAGRSAPLFAPDAKGLRALLSEQPTALEKGLSVYRNDDGSPVGAEYSTGVGDIDLLATDAEGGLVVVMVSETDQGDELVAEVLQRIGWVRKHLGKGGQRVRGIVLCESAPENLSYAAAAVADTVRFKTYRVALTFQDLEI